MDLAGLMSLPINHEESKPNTHMRHFQFPDRSGLHCRLYRGEGGLLTALIKGMDESNLDQIPTFANFLMAQFALGSVLYTVHFNAFISNLLHTKVDDLSVLMQLIVTNSLFQDATVKMPISYMVTVVHRGNSLEIYPDRFKGNVSSEGDPELFRQMLNCIADMCRDISCPEQVQGRPQKRKREVDCKSDEPFDTPRAAAVLQGLICTFPSP
jgi:hypothetical protein